MTRGSGRRGGVTLVVTLGTGIGSALFLDGRLLPAPSSGITINGIDCCPWASAAARARGPVVGAVDLGLQDYLSYAEFLIWPDLIIIGGGISTTRSSSCHSSSSTRPSYVEIENDAGIIGAAYEAARAILSPPDQQLGSPGYYKPFTGLRASGYHSSCATQ